jgi:hypothetical protein
MDPNLYLIVYTLCPNAHGKLVAGSLLFLLLGYSIDGVVKQVENYPAYFMGNHID